MSVADSLEATDGQFALTAVCSSGGGSSNSGGGSSSSSSGSGSRCSDSCGCRWQVGRPPPQCRGRLRPGGLGGTAGRTGLLRTGGLVAAAEGTVNVGLSKILHATKTLYPNFDQPGVPV